MSGASDPVREAPSAREAPAVIPLPAPADENRPGRKRSGSARRQRQDGVFVRLLPDELARLTDAADTAEMSVAGYLRSGRLGTGAAGRPARRRRPALDERLLARSNAELNHIGSNLNQTTRALNEIALTGMHSGNERLVRLVSEILEMNRRAYRELMETLAANRRALGYDREG
jgi:hypothetical protein